LSGGPADLPGTVAWGGPGSVVSNYTTPRAISTNKGLKQ
jgi:hypothetical protein